MQRLTDIAALQKRATALESRTGAVETKNTAQGTARASLDARAANLEKEVADLKYIITSDPDPAPDPPPADVYYNVMTDGSCHGDGVTDDRQHILDAITAYKAAGKTGLYFPAHDYYLASTLAVPANTVLLGAGAATTKFLGTVTYGSGCTYSGYTVTPPAGAAGPAQGLDPAGFTHRGSLYITGGHDLIYDGYWFEGAGYGSGDWGALVFIVNYSPTYNISFTNCVFGSNQNSGGGVKVVDLGGGSCHDILFDHCHMDYQPRIAFEINGRAIENGVGGQGYKNINLTNCTFDASAGEAISYDDDHEAAAGNAGYSTISGNVVEGAGVGNSYPYGQTVELNGVHYMTVTDNFFGVGRDSLGNFQGRSLADVNWAFSGNTWDGTHVPANLGNPAYGIPEIIVGTNVTGGVWGTVAKPEIIICPTTNQDVYHDTWAYFMASTQHFAGTGCHNMNWGNTWLYNCPSATPWNDGTTTGCTWPQRKT